MCTRVRIISASSGGRVSGPCVATVIPPDDRKKDKIVLGPRTAHYRDLMIFEYPARSERKNHQ